MVEDIYITEKEREKCQRVVKAFAELYELTDTLVVDAGKYGFVKLQYYMPPRGFEVLFTFMDSRKLFDNLWQDWFEEQVFAQVLGTPDEELEYEEIFAHLPKEKQDKIMAKRVYFAEKAEIAF